MTSTQQKALEAIKQNGKEFVELYVGGRKVSRATLRRLREMGYIKVVSVDEYYYYVGPEKRTQKELTWSLV